MIPRRIHLGILALGLALGGVGGTRVGAAQPDRVEVTVHLKRGDFTVYRYVPGDVKLAAHPRAVIIFGSGDGGLSSWEDKLSHALQASGYEVLDFDCGVYAKADYSLDILQSDMNAIAQSSLARYGDHPPPLILGGWSMGAEQSVAAAGGPHPPADLVGLLLISPGDRGRYGLRDADRWDVSPTGPGTFALQDFAHSLNKFRVAQWSASLDIFSSEKWLSSLTATHKAFDFPNATHYYNSISEAWYNGPSDTFLEPLRESVAWVLSPSNPAARKASGSD
jgi:hypothetical protein